MSGAQSNNENFWSLNNSRLKMYSGLENDRGAEWKCLQELCKMCVKWIIRESLAFRFTVIIFYQPRCQNSTPEFSFCSSRGPLSVSVWAHCEWEMWALFLIVVCRRVLTKVNTEQPPDFPLSKCDHLCRAAFSSWSQLKVPDPQSVERGIINVINYTCAPFAMKKSLSKFCFPILF